MDNEKSSKRNIGEAGYNQVTHSIKNIFELTTRIDERVQHMVKKQEDLDKKIENQILYSANLASRLAVVEANRKNEELSEEIVIIKSDLNNVNNNYHDLELKLQEVQGDASRAENRWKGASGFLVQIVWVIVAAYILYKLGLQSPP